MVARLGGDEFAILVNRPSEQAETAALAERLVEIVSNIYEIDDEVISIGVSIGIAIAPINGTRPDQILRNADLALYRAKADGRGMFRFFESHMDADVRERRMLELELRQALKDDELVLFYQPLVSAEDNVPTGFEALVRWNHPIRGLVPPFEFIPIAEQTGLIREVGDWTIRRACLSAAQWPEPLIVAVNLSAKHFQLSDIASVVSAALAESGLDPARLELEITESLLIERPEDVIDKLLQIKRLGVSIAMDDFGTGYSSLSICSSSVRQDQDRQVFRDGIERGSGGARHPPVDRLARQDAQDPHHRRGCRDAGAGAVPARHRLRPAAGLLLRQAAQRAGSRRLYSGAVPQGQISRRRPCQRPLPTACWRDEAQGRNRADFRARLQRACSFPKVSMLIGLREGR